MIVTRIIESDGNKLCETISTTGMNLRQIETGIVYGNSVIDTIARYDGAYNPLSRYTYEETDIKVDESEVNKNEN
ncbi:MAG: hypothetical protein Q4D35_02515 [Ruminococcus sp.]|nr:hypothetical protein [Ruminococcus sp.]